MHFTFFAVKRAHLRCVHKVLAPMLAPFGLTPARFDLLMLLVRAPWLTQTQSALTKALGVARSTVSRMVKSLARLGLVQRKREATCDGRQVYVSLTPIGRAVMRRARTKLGVDRPRPPWWGMLKPGPVERAAHTIFVRKWWCKEACFAELEDFETRFRDLREQVSDTASLYYPWHPDD